MLVNLWAWLRVVRHERSAYVVFLYGIESIKTILIVYRDVALLIDTAHESFLRCD